MNEKSLKIENLFLVFSILVAIVASIMIGNSVSTLENWAYRNWVNLLIFILVILSGVILTILVPLLGLHSYFSKKLGIKIKNFENICLALIITILITSFFGDDIIKVTSIAGSSLQDFLTFVGSYLGLFVLIGIYFLAFHLTLSIPSRSRKRKTPTRGVMHMNLFKRIKLKLFKRTKWKPKQKLRENDIQFLLAEYRVANTTSFISLTLCVSLLAIAAGAYFVAGSNPDIEVKFFLSSCAVASFLFLFGAFYLHQKSSRVAEVLQIKKRLERYGIKD